jgi:hypothetical protein
MGLSWRQALFSRSPATPVKLAHGGDMKTAPKMKRVIEQLTAQHEVNLQQEGAYLRLDMPGYDLLAIRRWGPRLVSVAHFFEGHGTLVAEPEVTFFVQQGQWVPIAIRNSLTGLLTYAEVSADGLTLLRFFRARQASLAQFVELWAQNLIDQGWPERGVKWEDPLQQALCLRGVTALFPLGQVVATPGALAALEQAKQYPEEFLLRHVSGDWGRLDEHDRQENERALVQGTRLFSAYETSLKVRIWVITEWDRSVTTLLLPSEY